MGESAIGASREERFEAWLHAILHRGNPGDEAFYERACREAGSVLELGCGTGRLLVRLARPGLRLVGVDAHRGMLAAAEERLAALDRAAGATVELVHADMRHLALGERFERVLIPYNGLLCLLDAEAVRSCLRGARDHLLPGGSLWFDIYAPPGPDELASPFVEMSADEPPAHLVTIATEGQLVDVFERDRWDVAGQRVDATYIYEIVEGGEVRRAEQTIPQRYLYERQVRDLLAEAGLRVAAMWGDFAGTPLTSSSPHMVVRARPADPSP
jgi:SAM-dependent methyltransferase